ncbi:MAG: Bax inhibitor-1/YccA family protein [Proteobacteria bacterium]|nr:MAG: Bax inhibitor-1/YccA family protein [Pseudomonadota bacterium]
MSFLEQDMRSISRDQVDQRATKFITDVYVRMMLALLGSAVIGYFSITSGLLMAGLENFGRGLSLGIFGTQLLTVIALQTRVFQMRPAMAQLLFILYAAVTGLTLGMVGLIYTLDSIFTVGLASVGGFAGLVAFGKITKRDLGPIGTFCIMGLMMLMVYSLGVWAVSYFAPSAAYMAGAIKIQGILGCLLFSGITAYEAQRLKKVAYSLAEQAPSDNELESYVNAGALNMYMNFIGLFLSMMRVFGGRK